MRQTFVFARKPVRFPWSDGNGQFLLLVPPMAGVTFF